MTGEARPVFGLLQVHLHEHGIYIGLASLPRSATICIRGEKPEELVDACMEKMKALPRLAWEVCCFVE